MVSEVYGWLVFKMADQEEVADTATSNENKILSIGLMNVLQPSVKALDDKVNDVRQSQLALREQIDRLSEDLTKLSDNQDLPIDLEPYVKKLISSRRRITLVNSILQNAQDRLTKLNQNISRETEKKKAENIPNL